MKATKFIAPVLAISLMGSSVVLTGCASNTQQENRAGGAVAGALIGGLTGAHFGKGTGNAVAIGAGALLGAFIGSEIGASLTAKDKVHADRAASRAYAAPIGETITWNNPDSGHRGSVTPVRDGYAQSGSYCREYQQTVSIGGRTERAYGTACRQEDGSWQIIN